MPWMKDEESNRMLLGIHRAIVVDRNDSSDKSDNPARGRIKVKIPYLSNDDDHVWLCDTCFPSNQFFSVPAVGDIVIVAFNSGHPEQPVWLGSVNTRNGIKDPPSRFSLEVPDNSGYESLAGHFIEFHDKAGIRHITLQDLKGNFQTYDTELENWNIHFHHDENRTIDHDVNDTIGHDEIRTISNDRIQNVGNDEHLTVGNDQTQDIGNDQTQTIGNDQTETVGNDRTITIDKDDSLSITGNRTTDVTGNWTETVTGIYSLDGQSTGDWTFQDTITFDTQSDFKQTVQGDWTADVQGDTKFTITGDWKNTVTGDLKDDVTGDIELKTAQKFTAKNTIFEFNMDTSTSMWKAGTTSITLTPASIVITVGAISWTMTSGGVVFVGSSYVLGGINHVTHRHLSVGTPPFTGTPTS